MVDRVAMATRQGLVSGNYHRRRDNQVREQVITLVKYLETVIHDIKYVVGDLQVLLEQIDLVSRQLDDASTLTDNSGDQEARKSHRCVVSQLTPFTLPSPLLARAKRVGGNAKRAKRSSKSRKYMHEDNSNQSSRSSLDEPPLRFKESVSEMDSVSVELNAMWDNAFDKDLIAGNLADDVQTEFEPLSNVAGLLCGPPADKSYPQGISWLEANMEQSLTSGIEMLSFTEDSEEDCISAGFPEFSTGYTTNPTDVCITVDPYHVCCKDVIPIGSGKTYCGVYEAAVDACLESYTDMTQSDSFNSDLSIFDAEEVDSVVSGVTYEPRYDTQLNTWTAFTMVPVESLHTSEEDLSDTALDILNDNLPASPVLDNVNKALNANQEQLTSTESSPRRIRNSVERLGNTTNSYILSC